MRVSRGSNKIARNAPCPCGSGAKYKKCCLGKDQPAPLEHGHIDALMQEGYRLLMAGRDTEACERWNETWLLLRDRLRPEMRTWRQAEVVFSGRQLIVNWAQDFSTALLNAVLDDAPRYGEIGIRFCSDVLAQFSDESEHFRAYFRGDLGDIHGRAGNLDEGEQVFLELIRDLPDSAIGYVKLADLLASGPGRTGSPIDEERARALLEQALDKHDAEDFDVARRLEDLRLAGHRSPA